MAKVILYLKRGLLPAILLLAGIAGRAQYALHIVGADRSDLFFSDTLCLPSHFANEQACRNFVIKLPELFESRGYPMASVDSVRYDSTAAFCVVYAGAQVRHNMLRSDSADAELSGRLGLGSRSRRPPNLLGFRPAQERALAYMENNGYPFAGIGLDSIHFAGDSITAKLLIDRGPLYKIDSIRNLGSAAISSAFLQQYLGIRNGSIYRREKLMDIGNRLRELPYLIEKQAWTLTLLGTGSILNVYLEPRKSSEVNVLIGLLPSNTQLPSSKLLVTGEATVNLKNSLGGGETIGLNWQQLQVKSPRLNLLFQQPYIFGSSFGLNFNFDLFKKDSSYVNVNIQIGAAYALSTRQTGSVFLQRLSSNLLTVDTIAVKSSRRLPDEADVSSTNLGMNYEVYATDYRFNPRTGNEFSVSATAGTKSIQKNNAIVKLVDGTDPSFNFNSLYDTMQLKSYQFRIRLSGAHYFPISHASTFKAGLSGAWFQTPQIFRNELFQIGGYKLLRGFDEESIFASAFAVATAEYRYLLGQNSYLAAFTDYGRAQNRLLSADKNSNFLGVGIGMAFETKAGIFNISYAVGKRDADNFNLRQSKIHLGYVNYF